MRKKKKLLKLKLKKDDKDQLRKMLISGTVMFSAFVIKQGLEAGYRKIRGKDAPKDPKHQDSDWFEAMMWAVATGAVLGVAKTLLRTQVRDGVDKLIEEI